MFQPHERLPQCVYPAAERALYGFIYLILYTVGSAIYSDHYILGEEYSVSILSMHSFISSWILR